jgi:hypothetical protein
MSAYRALGYVKVNRQAKHDHWSRLYREARIRRALSTVLAGVFWLLLIGACIAAVLKGH